MASSSNKKATSKRNVDLSWVLKYLRDGVYPPGLNFTEKRMVRKRAERFCFWREELYYLGTPTDQSLGKKTRKVLLTEDEQLNKIKECHVDEDGTHLGLERTAETIISQYHWNGIYKLIRNYIRQCKVCLERHPKMFGKRGTSEDQEEGSDAEFFGEETDSGAEDKEEETKFWSKVDLRVLGPYCLSTGERMVLIAVDGFSHWVEAFVLEVISADSIANSLLQMICRYGKMGCLTIGQSNSELKHATITGLQSLNDDSDMHIPLQNDAPNDIDEVYKKADELISDFVNKNPATWPEKIEFCLLPLRMSKHKKQPGAGGAKQKTKYTTTTTTSTEEEMNKAAEALMSVHKAQASASAKSPVPTTSAPGNVRGIVTRSRTGNTKPKPFDDDDYEVPFAKRKAGTNVVAQSSPVRKKARIDPASPETQVIDISTDVGLSSASVTESDNSQSPVKKIVDLDTYYQAIKMFLSGEGYQENATASFKRLVRDQSKNYSMKDGLLYHIVGPKREMKKVISTKAERLDLMTRSLLSPWSKSMMIQSLENCHWKGKMIDCEAFLLACPNNDKVDLNKPLKDVNTKYVGEAKKQLMFDTNDTYREISNYIIYDVFSNDETSKRLAYLQRQIKNFKMEDGELVHVTGKKKIKVLTTAKERQAAIAEAHLKKDNHADVTNTYHQLVETSFWFGMKFDVKVYTSLCCTNENRHMLDRYFLFREHLMKSPLTPKLEEDVEEEVVQTNTIEFVTDDLHVSEVTDDNVVEEAVVNVPSSPVKPSGIFVSSMKYVGDSSSAPKVTMETTQPVVTESGDSSQQAEVDTSQDDSCLEIENVEDSSQTILVKITEDGQAIIMREDGTDPTTDIPVREQVSEVVNTNSSDDVTTAVKSILQDTDAMNSLYRDGGTENEQMSQTVISDESEETERTTAEEGTNTEIVDDGGDSDNWMYGSDEEEEEEDEPHYSVLESIMQNTVGGEKKQVTPRPHFKCSQCNKIFYGPLKFKMHMYKHTGQKPFPCNLCNKKYTNKKSLVLHQKTHTGELPYLCSLCGKRCPSKISLKSHLKCHDGNGGGFPAKCDVCDRMFSRKHLMERHKLHKHTNLQTEFRCNECNKVFSHQRSLKRHFMSSHLNIKNHQCGLCGKSFYRKEYLTGHLIQHGGTAAEGLTPRKPRPSTFKPRPSVFNQGTFELKDIKNSGGNIEQFVALQDDQKDDEGVERIILTQDEDGQYRVVDMATEREVKRMLEARGINRGEAGETMVVHIEEPNGESQVVHVEHTEEQVVEVPLEEHAYIEYQQVGEEKPQEYVITESGAVGTSSAGGQFIYTSNSSEVSISGNQELIYGQPAVQYEVECVGDVGDEEALSAINLLAQASAQQYENVISQI